jgi:hypothetical protein
VLAGAELRHPGQHADLMSPLSQRRHEQTVRLIAPSERRVVEGVLSQEDAHAHAHGIVQEMSHGQVECKWYWNSANPDGTTFNGSVAAGGEGQREGDRGRLLDAVSGLKRTYAAWNLAWMDRRAGCRMVSRSTPNLSLAVPPAVTKLVSVTPMKAKRDRRYGSMKFKSALGVPAS